MEEKTLPEHPSFAEVLAAVRRIAGDRYCCLQVDATCASDQQVSVTWRGYIGVRGTNGWTDSHGSAAAMLADLEHVLRTDPSASVAGVGDPSQAVSS